MGRCAPLGRPLVEEEVVVDLHPPLLFLHLLPILVHVLELEDLLLALHLLSAWAHEVDHFVASSSHTCENPGM